MTNQQIFDTVCEHLATQKHRAMRTKNGKVDGCAYRSDNGDKCAAGCMIPDALYVPQMEGEPINSVIEIYPNVAALFESGQENLLRKLQWAHDFANDLKALKEDLKHAADYFDLKSESVNLITEWQGRVV